MKGQTLPLDVGGVLLIPLLLLASWWSRRDEFHKYEIARRAYANERLNRIRRLEI